MKKKVSLIVITILIAAVFGSVIGCSSTESTKETGTTNQTESTGKSGSDSGQSGETTPKAEASVELANFAMNPEEVTIKQGGKVTWTNKDSVEHTVTADKGEFESGQLSEGQTFSRTFDTAGTFAYHCTPHPSMTGTVVVK